MRFLKKLGFISAFIFFFLAQAGKALESGLIDEQELIYVGKQTIDYLNKWCPDAWCAGDYKYVFLNFVFNGHDKTWYLGFLSFPHALTEISESFSSPNNISSKQMVIHHSICSFPTSDPSTMLLLSEVRPAKVSGISQRMRENLNNCIARVQ